MAEFVYRDLETIVSNTLYTDGRVVTVTVGDLVRCKDCTEISAKLPLVQTA